ncbi:hypothetical protein RhiirA1_493337 [Rhizophagus irregularis]|uniref:Uncharacterized protein n=1 Tax=Rhizophagus irregularis TaxID=588596 RepID=A0A2N0R7K5_9GLOM|nr:hypothetical protein RhiirA1_493337 [Rhizophagus irregularis]
MWVGVWEGVGGCGSAGWECGSVGVRVGSVEVGVWECESVGLCVGMWVGSVGGVGVRGCGLGVWVWECGWLKRAGNCIWRSNKLIIYRFHYIVSKFLVTPSVKSPSSSILNNINSKNSDHLPGKECAI